MYEPANPIQELCSNVAMHGCVTVQYTTLVLIPCEACAGVSGVFGTASDRSMPVAAAHFLQAAIQKQNLTQLQDGIPTESASGEVPVHGMPGDGVAATNATSAQLSMLLYAWFLFSSVWVNKAGNTIYDPRCTWHAKSEQRTYMLSLDTPIHDQECIRYMQLRLVAMSMPRGLSLSHIWQIIKPREGNHV